MLRKFFDVDLGAPVYVDDRKVEAVRPAKRPDGGASETITDILTEHLHIYRVEGSAAKVAETLNAPYDPLTEGATT